MRIRICLDISKPLVHQKMFNIGLPEQIWLWFTYERLHDLYFYCGGLGHGHKDCLLWPSLRESYEKDGLQYGNWLKARNADGGRPSMARRSIGVERTQSTTSLRTRHLHLSGHMSPCQFHQLNMAKMQLLSWLGHKEGSPLMQKVSFWDKSQLLLTKVWFYRSQGLI